MFFPQRPLLLQSERLQVFQEEIVSDFQVCLAHVGSRAARILTQAPSYLLI